MQCEGGVALKAVLVSTIGMVAAVALAPASGVAQGVNPASGSFSQVVAIEVPAFRDLEPRLALGYSSQGRGGLAGVGWGVSGFSAIERASPGLGSPQYDASDVYVLDGRELLACTAGSTSPSCTTGGSHTSKDESYLKIQFDSGTNSWTVWQRDGTRTVLTAVHGTPAGTFTWGQTSAIDSRGNTVTYGWWKDGDPNNPDDVYPDSVTFGPYQVKLYRESRPDAMTAGIGASRLRQTRYRLRSVLVKHESEGSIRAYKLSYNTSPLTSRSLLTSVQQYGKDVSIDTSGVITSGTALPARTFEYVEDAAGRSFQPGQ
jgi:hypothetical protein